MKIRIDSKEIEVNVGTTVMDAATMLGIRIPSMCSLPGHSNHPTCMVCLVKEESNGKMFPSCAMPVSEGMNIITDSPDVLEARKEALELLLGDHVGDCEAPCRRSCPAFMDIPLMNRLIASGNYKAALRIVKEEIALPLTLGYICPAPCEKACHRGPSGGAVSICLLKRSTAVYSEDGESGENGVTRVVSGRRVAVVGTGPAGLSAAYYLLKFGHSVVLFDKNELPGGTLRYDIPDDRLPKELLEKDIDAIRRLGAEFRMNTRITKEFAGIEDLPGFDALVLATGNREQQPVEDFGFGPGETWIYDKKHFSTARPGVFVCGNIIRHQTMAVRSCAQGKAAAFSVHDFLSGNHDGEEKFRFHSVIPHLFPEEQEEYMKESIPGDRIVPAGGYLTGMTEEEAKSEAKRCLRCDCRKPVSCKLRIYAHEYQADRKRFAGHDRKRLVKHIQHETVIYEPEKCIKCGLCVEISGKEETAFGMAFHGRGFNVKVGVPFSGTMKEGLEKTAEECVRSCPTGALAFKEKEERLENE